jgi:hypothetical protein
VYEAITGLAAINFMDSHPGEIDLVVSDVVMPGVNGRTHPPWDSAGRACFTVAMKSSSGWACAWR